MHKGFYKELDEGDDFACEKSKEERKERGEAQKQTTLPKIVYVYATVLKTAIATSTYSITSK